jgi:hypothetical protein
MKQKKERPLIAERNPAGKVGLTFTGSFVETLLLSLKSETVQDQ